MQQHLCKFSLTTFIAVFAAMLFLPLDAFAVEVGTITLKDSTVYESVAFKVNSYHKTIEFQLDEDKKAVSFTDIASIVNQKGEDITESVLGGYSRPKEGESWKSESSVVYRAASKKLWIAAFQLGGHYCFPLGDYYQGFTSDIGFDANVILALTSRLGLRATISRAGMKAEEDLGYLVEGPEGYIAAVLNYDISTWRYLISLQYSNRFDPVTPGNTEWYLFTGLGAISHKISADEIIFGETPDLDVTTRISATETKFTTTFGAGIVQLLSPTVGFYIGADFDLLYLGRDDSYDYWGSNIAYAYQFDLKLGFTFLLPSEPPKTER